MPRWSAGALASDATPLILSDMAKLHLRIDHGDEDTLVDLLIAAVSGHLDGPGAVLGRAVVRRTWTGTIDASEVRNGGIPMVRFLGPVALSAVRVRVADAWQDIAAGDFRLCRECLGFSVHATPGAAWPQPEGQADLYQFDIVAGMDPEGGEFAAVRAAALLMLGHVYANREGGASEAYWLGTVQALLANVRDGW